MFYHRCLDVKLPGCLPKETVKLRRILPKVTHNATGILQTVKAGELTKKYFAEMLKSRVNDKTKDNSGYENEIFCNTQTNDLEKVPTTVRMTNSKQADTSIKISKETDTNVQVSRVADVGNPHVSITCSQTNDNIEKTIKQSGKESETDVNFSSKVNSKRINENSIEKAGSELQLVGSVPVESPALSKGW